MEQTKLQALVNILLESDSKELYIESEFEKVRIIRSYNEAKKTPKPKPASMVKIIDETENEPVLSTNEIKSTLVGIFHFNKDYSLGDKIMVGERIGYVESLKIRNDVISDFSGDVCEIPVQEGETVEYGQVLMVVK